MKRIRPDVVITNTAVIPGAALAAKRLGIPHIWYIREFGNKDHGFTFDLGLGTSIRLIHQLSDAVVANCIAIRRHLGKWVPESSVDVVYNSVELDVSVQQLQQWRSAAKSDKPGLRCTIVGAVRSSKGQEEAIRAIGMLAKDNLPASLTIVGAGEESEFARLRSLVLELGIADRVEFTGFTTEPLRYFCEADVALVCSKHEAFGRTSVEALKCGCPVLGTDRGGIVEHITNGINGYTYPQGDVAALASHLRRLSERPELVERMARASARSASLRYTSAKQVSEVETILDRVLGRS